MEIILTAVLVALVAVVVGSGLGFQLHNILSAKSQRAVEEASAQQMRRSNARSKEILLEAKEQALQLRSDAQAQVNDQKLTLQRQQSRLEAREEILRGKADAADKHESQLQDQRNELIDEKSKLDDLRQQAGEKLEAISGLSMSDARQQLIDQAQEDIEFELARRYRDAELVAQDEADDKARLILAESMQRLASEVVSEATVTSIPLPNDDMKGRLIGREGRNIRAIEGTTGVDLIIDDVPEAITISCFDPIRREIARVAISSLIKDGRIHPARIEESVNKARSEVDEVVRKAGQKATFDADVKGLHPELVKLIGRLKFRYSYGENVLQHSVEVGLIAGILAAQIGANPQTAKTAGFLHDIGKALTHEVDGPHAEIGADLAKRYGQKEPVVKGIREHHDREMTTVESFLVAAADAISAARPGARQDTIENYIQRLEALEEVAQGFEGVERVYAIQAGREVRVLVNPENTDDVSAATLARNIVEKIEETLAYPGQIRVVVIRESRTVEIAQ
ncbi:MAG: ribonuclease Y [SAR202 cluster bacterium]|jgi:ribonuclease Y|nr:MAG: ribonuclease Y [SAR202 cluster bacterium]MBF06618.1 ribonuclease Y [Chloroflexota bacterium]MCH2529680.1 ribonuclease Y [Dehalococcoidia bacterium]KAA1301061.1 MAG: ribonuclease Y [SAR202 cluster bacterium]KAA1304319.1 MAG: ribonuclease Y [SAR202 cluster bacterium]|tara:strand:+ start:832 stop:2361 length:1530 start_codon:yes stop_codon:yes gene_type:complete